MLPHLVRYSLFGTIGSFSPVDSVRYAQRTRVLIRSPRGLEVGEVLAADPMDGVGEPTDGQILRKLTVEDELLVARLEKHRHEAFAACAELLEDQQIEAALVDVEHLFDGQGLYFYFLGDVPAEAEAIVTELAETYETAVEFRKFADTLTQGCGPGCGTEEAMGQGGCESCTSCAVASACKTKA